MDLNHCILQTLKYSEIFNFPLTKKEIYKYLISNKPYSYNNVSFGVQNLYSSHQIKKFGVYYGTKSLDSNVSNYRKNSKKLCKKYIFRASVDLKIISKLWFIKFIGITGSVSAKNVDKNADFDLFIITSKNFLWTSRLVVTLYLLLKGVYKKPYCANIYIPINNLIWPAKNIYVANEIARLQPLFNKSNTYEYFLQKNTWVCEYLANFKTYIPKYNIYIKKSFISFLFFPLEYFLYVVQKAYMRPKLTTEQVGLSFIHFLKNDYTQKVLRKAKHYHST